MPIATANSCSTTASPPPRKSLLFDRRYGWVLDEWKEPSEEALSGGRGMFCIVPLAKALLTKASESSYVETAATPQFPIVSDELCRELDVECP